MIDGGVAEEETGPIVGMGTRRDGFQDDAFPQISNATIIDGCDRRNRRRPFARAPASDHD